MSLHLSESDESHDSLNQSDLSPPSSPSSPVTHAARVLSRRKRTVSECEKILAGPTFYGRMTSFCREKGHGFVQPAEGGEPLFVHISDITGDLVPKEGDEVSFKRCPIPPKNLKFAAVHVQIVKPASGVSHETWDKSGRKLDVSECAS